MMVGLTDDWMAVDLAAYLAVHLVDLSVDDSAVLMAYYWADHLVDYWVVH